MRPLTATVLATLADQNDAFRKLVRDAALYHDGRVACQWRGKLLNGQVTRTPGIAQRPPASQTEIIIRRIPRMTTRYIPALLLGVALLSACQPTTTSSTVQPVGRAGNGGEARSEVQIIDGTAFTATWRERPSAEVRLTFDSTVAMSDTELLDVAQTITGCAGAGAMTEPTLVGSIATVRIPMACGTAPAADTAL